jgi:hypothetical protein
MPRLAKIVSNNHAKTEEAITPTAAPQLYFREKGTMPGDHEESM